MLNIQGAMQPRYALPEAWFESVVGRMSVPPVAHFNFNTTRLATPVELFCTNAICVPSSERTGDVRIVLPVPVLNAQLTFGTLPHVPEYRFVNAMIVACDMPPARPVPYTTQSVQLEVEVENEYFAG
jgi:hypothetical protein